MLYPVVYVNNFINQIAPADVTLVSPAKRAMLREAFEAASSRAKGRWLRDPRFPAIGDYE